MTDFDVFNRVIKIKFDVGFQDFLEVKLGFMYAFKFIYPAINGSLPPILSGYTWRNPQKIDFPIYAITAGAQFVGAQFAGAQFVGAQFAGAQFTPL